MVSKFAVDIITNVFVMFGVIWLIDNWWCGVMCREMYYGAKMIISFLAMMALYFWRVGE